MHRTKVQHLISGALHKLSEGALIQEETAIHINIGAYNRPSVSTQIGLLRRLLHGEGRGALGEAFDLVSKVSLCED